MPIGQSSVATQSELLLALEHLFESLALSPSAVAATSATFQRIATGLDSAQRGSRIEDDPTAVDQAFESAVVGIAEYIA
jgi:hypothetical protein